MLAQGLAASAVSAGSEGVVGAATGCVATAAGGAAVGVAVGGGPGVGAITAAVAVGGAGVDSLIGVMTACSSGVGGGWLAPSPISAEAQNQRSPIRISKPATGKAMRR